MTLLFTIINGLFLIIMIAVAVVMYNMISSFGELIVRFVESNQEHFKNQKHLVAKSSELATSMKKAPNIVSNLKAMTRKLDSQIVRIDTHLSRMGK